jgi:uroporphyrinogen decarboxylase
MEVVMVDKKGPHFPSPLTTPADAQFKEIIERKVDIAKELGYVYETITLTRHKLQGRVPLIGFCGAPWTLFVYMVEGGGAKIYKDVKTWIYKYPEASKAMLDKLATLCIEHLALQVQAGAQMIQVFDSNAGELSPASFKSFSYPYLVRIADELPARLKALGLDAVPMTVFAKGAWYALRDLCETNYNVISLDWLHDPAESYSIAQAKGKTLQGNADPGVLYGGREAITKVVEEMVKGFGGGKQGWIANLGHGMMLPPANYMLMGQELPRLSTLTICASSLRKSVD